QIKEESMSVLSSDGLDIKIDVSVRFRPVQSKIGFLHDEIGKMYRETIVADLTRATVRRIIGRYTPEEIYRNKREEIETRLQEELTISLEDKYIVLESALLREIKLPEQIENAIQDKLKAKEEAAKIDFQIERQKKESERIRIEALAKAEANRILSASLTDKILQEKGILATQELAKSPNTKVVVVGGKDGLPLILNQ
ncbi:MAG: prohibitin family protein, partial [Bacteroidota bacterium]